VDLCGIVGISLMVRQVQGLGEPQQKSTLPHSGLISPVAIWKLQHNKEMSFSTGYEEDAVKLVLQDTRRWRLMDGSVRVGVC